MTLKEFAELAGVILLTDVDEEKWGGRFGYTLKDEEGKYSVLGMETEERVYESWAERTFGEEAKNALVALLTPAVQSKPCTWIAFTLEEMKSIISSIDQALNQTVSMEEFASDPSGVKDKFGKQMLQTLNSLREQFSGRL